MRGKIITSCVINWNEIVQSISVEVQGELEIQKWKKKIPNAEYVWHTGKCWIQMDELRI